MDYKSILLKQDKKVFKTDDLALLWEITNRNTLLTTIKRYLKNKTLFSVRKGLYSVKQPGELDPYLIGTSYVSGFCYVSLQTVLENHGVINQNLAAVTLVGRRTLTFTIAANNYICKKMSPKFLNNIKGINLDGEYPVASLERAMADTLYFNSSFHFDANITQYMEKVKQIQKEVFA